MVENRKMLVISNGHGEDVIGANLVRELLSRQNGFEVKVLPVVGEGRAYQGLPVEPVGPVLKLPSGGLARFSLQNLLMDLRAGLLGLTLAQVKTLRSLRRKIDHILVVGDIYVLLLAGLFVRKEVVFLPTAKSEYITGHYQVEKLIMRRMADLVLPRDSRTTNVLQQTGVNAVYAGNAMMDCFTIQGVDFHLESRSRIVGILPGSRDDAYLNMLYILQVIEELEARSDIKLEYLAALAGRLSPFRMEKVLGVGSWNSQQPTTAEKSAGIERKFLSPSGKSVLRLVCHHFGDVLDQAEIFMGLAGTANEQAAGMGKPVITFPGTGSQFTLRFAREQKQLLGDAVALVKEKNEQEIAGVLLRILSDRVRYEKMSRTGRQRMGPRGGISRMVELICEFMDN